MEFFLATVALVLAFWWFPVEECWVPINTKCGKKPALYEKSHDITSVVIWHHIDKIDLT